MFSLKNTHSAVSPEFQLSAENAQQHLRSLATSMNPLYIATAHGGQAAARGGFSASAGTAHPGAAAGGSEDATLGHRTTRTRRHAPPARGLLSPRALANQSHRGEKWVC